MGDERHRHAEFLLQLAEQQQNLDLHGDVQCRGGFVGEKHVRVAGQCQGNHGTLARAAGHFVRLITEAAPRGEDAHMLRHPSSALHGGGGAAREACVVHDGPRRFGCRSCVETGALISGSRNTIEMRRPRQGRLGEIEKRLAGQAYCTADPGARSQEDFPAPYRLVQT